MEGLESRSGSVKEFEFQRHSAARLLRNSCFAFCQFYIELKTFFVFTPCVQFKPKFKFCRILTKFHQGLFKSLRLMMLSWQMLNVRKTNTGLDLQIPKQQEENSEFIFGSGQQLRRFCEIFFHSNPDSNLGIQNCKFRGV